MKKIALLFLFHLSYWIASEPDDTQKLILNKNVRDLQTRYEWTIVGAGPAGVIAVAILLDLGVPPSKIFWIDPSFSVGRMGEYYGNVDGNTPNKLWITFLEASPSIAALTQDDIAYFKTLDPECYCTLDRIVLPLQKVTQVFLNKVDVHYGYLEALDFWNGVWHVQVNELTLSSRSVILAIGAEPIVMHYEEGKFADVVPLDYALNKKFLESTMKPTDTIAVFGGAHSAVLILKYLTDLKVPVKQIYNFFNRSIINIQDSDCPILKNGTGPLLGVAGWWVKNVLLKNPPINLTRYENTELNRKKYLMLCNKIIFAIGYKILYLPEISIHETKVTMDNIAFDAETGIIAPRLFGFGIAFPRVQEDVQGNKQLKIGLNSFLEYALDLMPTWVTKINNENRAMLLRSCQDLHDYIDIQLL